MNEGIIVFLIVAAAVVYTLRRLASGKDTDGECHSCDVADRHKLSR